MPAGSTGRRAAGVGLVGVAVALLWQCSLWEAAPVPTGVDPGVLDAEAGFSSYEQVDSEPVPLERRGSLQGALLMARFEFCGVVLRNGRDSDGDIDVDVTLAYGGLARPEAFATIRNELFGYRFDDGFPFDGPYFQSHITRFHVIAASANIQSALLSRERGEAVRLAGHLVYMIRSGRVVKTDLNPRAFVCKYAYVTQVATSDDVFE